MEGEGSRRERRILCLNCAIAMDWSVLPQTVLRCRRPYRCAQGQEQTLARSGKVTQEVEGVRFCFSFNGTELKPQAGPHQLLDMLSLAVCVCCLHDYIGFRIAQRGQRLDIRRYRGFLCANVSVDFLERSKSQVSLTLSFSFFPELG